MIKKFFSVLIFLSIQSFFAHSSVVLQDQESIKFTKTFGFCPTKIGGEFTERLYNEFLLKKSLGNLKKIIEKENLDKKSFLSEYRITYTPILNQLNFKIDCPKPLLRLKVIATGKSDVKEYGILVDNGKIFDPTYEIFLLEDNKKVGNIGEMSIFEEYYNLETITLMTNFLSNLPPILSENISELFYDKKGSLNIIFSLLQKPVVVMMNERDLNGQVERIEKMFKYFVTQKKIPSIVNLRDSKKIVVKFPTNI